MKTIKRLECQRGSRWESWNLVSKREGLVGIFSICINMWWKWSKETRPSWEREGEQEETEQRKLCSLLIPGQAAGADPALGDLQRPLPNSTAVWFLVSPVLTKAGRGSACFGPPSNFAWHLSFPDKLQRIASSGRLPEPSWGFGEQKGFYCPALWATGIELLSGTSLILGL